jgi:hypothetical protein
VRGGGALAALPGSSRSHAAWLSPTAVSRGPSLACVVDVWLRAGGFPVPALPYPCCAVPYTTHAVLNNAGLADTCRTTPKWGVRAPPPTH